jgi:putative metallohydrolase (TIGR04338 family)
MAIIPKEKQKPDTQRLSVYQGESAVNDLLYYMSSNDRSAVELVLKWENGTRDPIILDTVAETAAVVKSWTAAEIGAITARPYKSLADIQTFVAKIVAMPTVLKAFPVLDGMKIDVVEPATPPAVPSVEGEVEKTGDNSYSLKVWQNEFHEYPRPILVIHELSHIAAPEEPEPHGPEFVETYLHLTELVLGVAIKDLIAIQYRHRNVKGVKTS